MNNNIQRSVAAMTVAALLAGTVAVGTAQAEEPFGSSVIAVANINSEIDRLQSKLPTDLQDAFTELSNEEDLTEQDQIEILRILANESDEQESQTRGKVGAVAKALRVVSKIFKGAKWIARLAGYLDDASNWSQGKIRDFLISVGVNSSTANTVARIVIGILL